MNLTVKENIISYFINVNSQTNSKSRKIEGKSQLCSGKNYPTNEWQIKDQINFLTLVLPLTYTDYWVLTNKIQAEKRAHVIKWMVNGKWKLLSIGYTKIIICKR